MTTISFVALAVLGRTWNSPRLLCETPEPSINESSGLAVDPARGGGFFTHNDSGDTARFFRLSADGKLAATYSLKGVRAVDWEDMCGVRLGRTEWLYLADVGDNARRRASIQVHRVKTPSGASREISQFETFTIKYEDKARDCEAVFVNPKSGDIWLVSKNREGETVAYVVRRPRRSGAFTAKKAAVLDVNTGGLGGNMVTGGDASADGRHVVLRTYSGALEFDAGASFDSWVKAKPRPIQTAAEAQGEAVCYSRDGKKLYTSTEGTPLRISAMTLAGP